MQENEIFIVGASGQLGTALRAHYPNAQFADIDELDITNKASVEDFDWSNIKTIINAAAYTNVDEAETSEGRIIAWEVNAVAVANLVHIAQDHDMTLIHVSSDYVFDGTKEVHTEDEPFSPLSVYGQSKAAGDIIVGLLPKYYILRTTWVIGEGKNFVRTMLKFAAKGVSPTVVADQIGRLTFTSELVRAINHLLTSHAPYGVYNTTNDGALASWAEVTREIFRLADYESLTVTDTTTAAYFKGKEGVAPRPLGSNMNLSKLHATGFISRPWEEDLRKYIINEREQTT